ncbi:hypothetical protein DdX_06588 [Ditylenchus destructor]|uniref:Uncharacterized protein n=1 Tax=Ditylenchus destructor TaxID=166010 RepID=A0AAD4N840_9BILA|nr:hypothetical protein DdX_06588 [Ditylenchus destructor]
MVMLPENEPRCLQGRYMLANMAHLVGGDREFICFLSVINGFQRVYQKQLTNEEKKKYFGHMVKDVNIRDILIRCCYAELEVSQTLTGPEPACMPFVKLRKPIKEIKEYFSRYLGADLPTTALRQNNEASTQRTSSRSQKREHAFGERPLSRYSTNSPAYDDQSRDEYGNTLTYSTSPRAPLQSPNPFRPNPDRTREVPQRREAFVERPLSRNCGFSSYNNRQPDEFEKSPFYSNSPKQPTESTNPFRSSHSNGINEIPQRRVYGFRERPLSRNSGFSSNSHQRDEFENAPCFSNSASIPNDSSFRRNPGVTQSSPSQQAQETSQFHRSSQPEQLRSAGSAFEPARQNASRNEKPTLSCDLEDDDSIWDKLENSEQKRSQSRCEFSPNNQRNPAFSSRDRNLDDTKIEYFKEEKNQMRNENGHDGIANEQYYQTNSDSTSRARNIPASSRSTSMFDLSSNRASNLVDKESSRFERQKQIHDQSRHAESSNVQDHLEHSFATSRTANLPTSSQSMVNLHEGSNIEENYDADGRISARNQNITRMLKEKFSHNSKPALSCITEEDDDSVWNKLAAEPRMSKNANNERVEYTKRDEGQYTPINQSSDSENEALSSNRAISPNRANTDHFNGPLSSTVFSDKRGVNAGKKTSASGGECSSDDDNGENILENIDKIIDKTLDFAMKTGPSNANSRGNMSEQPAQESLSRRINTGSVYDVSARVRHNVPSVTKTMSMMSLRSNIPCRRMPIEVTPQRIETLAKIINAMVHYHAPKSIELTTVLDFLDRVDTQFEAVFEHTSSTPVDFVDNYCDNLTVSQVGDEVFLSWHK